jgi:hypothetical protein
MARLNQVISSLSVLGAAFGGALAFGQFVAPASAELVLESPSQAPSFSAQSELAELGESSVPRDTESLVEDRESTRQVVEASRRAELAAQPKVLPAPRSAQRPVVQPAVPSLPVSEPVVLAQQVVEVAPPAYESAYSAAQTGTASSETGATEVQHFSKSEMLRRARLREELRNEDMLQERLEELRLGDEKRRAEQVLAGSSGLQAPAANEFTVPASNGLAAPVVATPEYVGSLAPQQPSGWANQPAASTQASASDQIVVTAAAAQTVAQPNVESSEEESKTRIVVAPRAGLSNMVGTQLFNVQSRYSAGLSLGVGITDFLFFDLGYTFSDYGVGIASSNYWINQLQFNLGAAYTNNFATYSLKQNVFDAGLKLYLLGRDSKLRPFLGGGGAYGRSYLNYDPSILAVLNQLGAQNLAMDYEATQFLGFLQAGFDVSLARNVQIGAGFRYHTVLSANENSALNPYAFYYGNPDPSKTTAGGSLARSNFYSILGTASFSF